MARTFDVVVLSIHPATDRTLVVAEVRYTPRQDNVEFPKAGGSTIAQVKQQKTIVHVWGDYSGRTEDELSKDTAFRKLAVYEAGRLISDFLNERGMLS